MEKEQALHFQIQDSIIYSNLPFEKAHLHEIVLQSHREVVFRSKKDKGAKINETHEHFGVSSAFAPSREPVAGFEGGLHMGMLEHGLVDKFHVLRKVQVWSNKNTREIKARKQQILNCEYSASLKSTYEYPRNSSRLGYLVMRFDCCHLSNSY